MKFYLVDLTKKRLILSIIGIIIACVLFLCPIENIVDRMYCKTISSVSSNATTSERIIIIDAGHGGEDSGAVGVSGVLEKDLNLEYALEIGQIFEEKGFIVVYTRTDDKLLYKEDENVFGIRKISDLKNRCKFTENYPNAIFLSIHMNSFGSAKYKGLQVYYSENDDNSRNIAQSIQNKVKEDIQPDNNRSIKAGNGIYLLENISNPAVLVECGFLTNVDECEKLSKKEYKKELSFSIVCGIIEYIDKISDNKGS